MTADVIEGKRGFADLWAAYHDWWRIGREPAITMVESSPHDQIAYGYDYSPLQKTPPSTLEFARTYYPNVRFGLAFTLMNDGFFAHEFGDTWHGNDWWYDELDFDLGLPLGAAERVQAEGFTQRDRIDNGGFETPLEGTWGLSLNTSFGAAATLARDTSDAAEGSASARITYHQRRQPHRLARRFQPAQPLAGGGRFLRSRVLGQGRRPAPHHAQLAEGQPGLAQLRPRRHRQCDRRVAALRGLVRGARDRDATRAYSSFWAPKPARCGSTACGCWSTRPTSGAAISRTASRC